MSGLYLASKGWPAQDHLPIAELNAISEIGMAARKLCDAEVFCLTREMIPQKNFELAKVESLAGSNGSWFVAEVGHVQECGNARLSETLSGCALLLAEVGKRLSLFC